MPGRSATSARSKLQERDHAVLDVFRAVRFADTAMLGAILTPDPFPTVQRLRLRLPKLAALGLIDRPARRVKEPEFVLAADDRERGRPQDIWALADAGARLLGRAGDWNRNNRRLKPGSFAHPLSVTRVYATLRTAVARGLADLDAWHGENVFRDTVVVGGNRLPVVPDATFELSTDGEGLFRAFLEVDNATEPLSRSSFAQSSFFKKCVAYRAYRRRQLKPFHVLTITKTPEGADRLRRLTSRFEREEDRELFWFAAEADYAPATPEAFLFGEIWKTAAGASRAIFTEPATQLSTTAETSGMVN